MLPKFHIIFGLIFSSFLYFIFPEITLLTATIIFLSSFLIDIDHYLFYAVSRKTLNFKKARGWFIKKHNEFISLPLEQKLKSRNIPPCIFHGFETIIILISLSFLSKVFLYILIGFLFHEFLDFIFAVYYNSTLKHMGSQTYNILKYKKII